MFLLHRAFPRIAPCGGDVYKVVAYFIHPALHLIGISWRKVGEDLGAVQTLPEKCVVLQWKRDKLVALQALEIAIN